jgi:stage IV sporulation protein FB
LVNVAIAAVIIVVLGLSFDSTAMTELENPRAGLMMRLAAANIFLVVFNMIPAFPMDGGRVLRAVLAMRMNYADATRMAARIGQGAAFVFALLGLFGNPMLIIIALFVYLAASAEAQDVSFRGATQGLPVHAGMVSPVETLGTASTLDDAVDLMLRTSQREFPVVDGSGHPRGLLTRDGLIVALRQGGPATPVLEVMTRDLPTVQEWQPFNAAMALLNKAKAPALLVLNQDQRLVGLLTPENIGEMMMVRAIHPDWRFRDR